MAYIYSLAASKYENAYCKVLEIVPMCVWRREGVSCMLDLSVYIYIPKCCSIHGDKNHYFILAMSQQYACYCFNDMQSCNKTTGHERQHACMGYIALCTCS